MCSRREMTIYVQERRDDWTRGDVFIDVAKMGVDAQCHRYSCLEETGIVFIVQAYLLTQRATIHVLREALTQIDSQYARSITFACDHATHRSVGCACLLASLFFPQAKIVLSTPRTRRQAMEYNMIVSNA